MALNLGQLLAAPTGGRTGGVKAGTNISISADGTISVSPGGAVGTITAVISGDGLTGGGASGAVTLNVGAGTGITVNPDSISISNTSVTAGTYTLGNFTVNAQGQITAASTTTPASVAVTSVTAGAGLTGGGGPGPVTLNVGAGTGITVAADTVSVTPNTYVLRAGDTMTGPLVLNTAGTTQSITANAPEAFQTFNATGGVNSRALTEYRTLGAAYFVGTSNGYVNDVFYIGSSAIAGQAGSQIGISMYPWGDTHLANTNTNLAGGPLVRIGPNVTLNSAGLARLNVESRDVGATGFICEWYNNSPTAIGSITVNGLGVNYNTTSDYRLKENVSPLVNSIDRLKLLKPVHYNYKEHPEALQDGFIAHEVQPVVPAAVTGNKDEVNEEGVPVYQGLDTSKLVPLLTASLQEAVYRIEALESELAALKGS